jgi:RNA polymerase sigma-70 factor (ECF subfamily)
MNPETSPMARGVRAQQTILSDEELLLRFLAGDERSFRDLMKRYRDLILNFAYRFLGDYDDAVDIAQETFIRLYRFGHTFQGEVKFSTWLYTIAANLARSELKRYRRRHGSLLSEVFKKGDDAETWDIPDENYRPDERVDSTHISQAVQRALMHVSPSYREMVVMRDIQQMSYEEIAMVTGTEMGTVKSRINRGRLQLQHQLRDLYIEVFGQESE